MFYVVKRDRSVATGWKTVGTAKTEGKANKLASKNDTVVNGKRLNLCKVLTLEQYRNYLFSSVSLN